MISVVVPVYREGAGVDSAVKGLYELGGGCPLEVIVVDGDQGGSTLARLTDLRPTGIFSPPGRGRQMNAGARIAKGSILLFLHADTVLPAGSLDCIRKTMGAGYAAGAFRLRIESPRRSLALVSWATSLRSRITRVPFGDQAIFVKSEIFREMGGYREVPIMEDVDLMRRIKKRGGRIRILPGAVRTSARRWEKEGVAFCTLRNLLLRSLFLLGVPAERLAGFYPTWEE